jgi:hypothetical protein
MEGTNLMSLKNKKILIYSRFLRDEPPVLIDVLIIERRWMENGRK